MGLRKPNNDTTHVARERYIRKRSVIIDHMKTLNAALMCGYLGVDEIKPVY